MKFKNFIENDCHKIKLSANQRLHTTDKPELKIYSVSINQQKIDMKPKGLWYACGLDWIEWCEGENFRLEGLKHKFILDIDFSDILVLDNNEKILDFSKKYGSDTKYEYVMINWRKVSEDYSGVEICPYSWGLRMKLMWYYGWDVASGCIWNKDVVENITKL